MEKLFVRDIISKTLIVLILTLFAVNSYASNLKTAAFSIEMIRASVETNTAYVKPHGNVEIKNSTCDRADLYAISMADSNFDALYSALLSAAAAKQQVRLRISSTPGNCLIGRQRIRVVDVLY